MSKKIIPEREDIYRELENRDSAVGFDELLSLFNLDEHSAKFFGRRLSKMLEVGQLLVDKRGNYRIGCTTQFIDGIVEQDSKDLVVRCSDGQIITLPPRLISKVFISDRVRLGMMQLSQTELRPVSVQVVERRYELIGLFSTSNRQATPINIPIPTVDIIASDLAQQAKDGETVVVRLLPEYLPSKPVGEIVEVLGFRNRSGLEVDSVIGSFGLPHRWSEPIEAEVAQCLAQAETICAEADREDLTSLPFVTIDGKDAKDFDDAIFCQKENNKLIVWVAIADVASYVKPGSALDQEALLRGNSVYFPGRVVPMLPPELSDDLCSLRPQQNRPVLACRMVFDLDGQMLEYKFSKALIRSQHRLTYREVNAFLTDTAPPIACSAEVKTMLGDAHKIYLALKKLREARGALNLDVVQTQLLFDADQKIKAVVPVVRNDAHRLIEELMICANVAAAQFLSSHHQCFLHRVHEGIKPEAREELNYFLHDCGFRLYGTSSESFARLIKEIAGHPHQHIIQSVILRSLKRALYTPLDNAHFGLALRHYTHFTSPIRRYSDLLVHRAVHQVLGSAVGHSYSESEVKYQGEYCSMTERRADEAVRDVEQYLRCLYAQNYLGKSFAGVVTAVTSFGLFIELDELYVTGLLHVRSLSKDYYQFDQVHYCLIGEDHGETFRLGDKLLVSISHVDADQRKIDLILH